MTNISELTSAVAQLKALEETRLKLERAMKKSRARVGRLIERERTHRRITLSQVAGVSDTAICSVSRAETGDCLLSNQRLLDIAHALLWIIENETTPTP